MKRRKVSIIGAGFVGSTTAHWLVNQGFFDVVLLDIEEGPAQGKALDLSQSMAIEGVDVQVQGTKNYADTKGSDLIVITAGSPRKEGMNRDDLLQINAKIMTSVCEQVKKFSPSAFVIVVSNPLDIMTYQAKRVLNFPKQKVIGMAGILDTARFKTFIAKELNVSVKDIQTMVLGGHGDTMVPVLSQTFVGGQPISGLLPESRIEALVQRTKKGGGEIVKLLQKGSAYFAPSRGVFEMVQAILQDQKRILPCTVYLEGEYGYKDLYVGVPCQLGGTGVEKVIEIPLTGREKEKFQKSAQAIRKGQDSLKEIYP